MPREIDILIADGASTRIGKAVLKSLRGRGLACEAIDDSSVTKDEFGYLRLLKATLKDVRPKVLMPVFKGELIARNMSMVPGSDVSTGKALSAMLEGIAVPVSPADTIDQLDDKVSASALCTGLGIPQPRLYSDEEALENPQMLFSAPGRPVVFKRSTGLGGDSVYFPKNGISLANIIGSAGVRGRPHLIMDYIDGYDVSVDAIRWNGWFQAAGYRTMVPKRKGTSLVRVGVDMPELVGYARQILDAVDYRGACGIDFRIDRKSGKAFFLECNPRFSGGLKSSLAAGFDMPYILWQLCRGEMPEPVRLRHCRLSIEWEEILSRR
ncbi:MAG: ATP-grasp domain-containing protein [Bacteroidales bacterium]|nr:ATP-grasp domain-containing protein [Bacteroidales bacterium]